MTLKAQQVLRTKVPLRDSEGRTVTPGTRVVVLRLLEDGKARVRTADPTFPDLKVKLEANPGAFSVTKRGRPTKATK